MQECKESKILTKLKILCLLAPCFLIYFLKFIIFQIRNRDPQFKRVYKLNFLRMKSHNC